MAVPKLFITTPYMWFNEKKISLIDISMKTAVAVVSITFIIYHLLDKIRRIAASSRFVGQEQANERYAEQK